MAGRPKARRTRGTRTPSAAVEISGDTEPTGRLGSCPFQLTCSTTSSRVPGLPNCPAPEPGSSDSVEPRNSETPASRTSGASDSRGSRAGDLRSSGIAQFRDPWATESRNTAVAKPRESGVAELRNRRVPELRNPETPEQGRPRSAHCGVPNLGSCTIAEFQRSGPRAVHALWARRRRGKPPASRRGRAWPRWRHGRAAGVDPRGAPERGARGGRGGPTRGAARPGASPEAPLSARTGERPSIDARRVAPAQPAAHRVPVASHNLARCVWRRVGDTFGANGRCASWRELERQQRLQRLIPNRLDALRAIAAP